MKNFFRLASLVFLLATLTGCGIIDYYLLPPPEDTAQELMEAGQDAMKEKQYGDAAGYFTKLKDRYPFSPYAPQAELGLGDAHFLNEDYAAAADAYSEFEALHPRHEEIPYVLYQLGQSNYNRFKSIDMPQDFVGDAIESLTRLVEEYPDSKYVSEARELIVKCRRYQAEHELFVADFYWNSERYGAAWKRYKYVAKNFKDLPDIMEYAAKRAELSYFRYQKDESEASRERIQGSWKEWFDWL